MHCRPDILLTDCLLLLMVLSGILLLVPVVQALEPAWNYSSPTGEIGGVAVSPKGDLIVTGDGKVLFFSRGGTLLAKEPFGSDVMMTPDGKYTASAYASSVYLFKNPLPGGSTGQQEVTKLGDFGLSEQVYSFDVSRDGNLIAGQTQGRSLFTVNTKTGVISGNTKRVDAVIRISPSGGRIIGISQDSLHSYTITGALSRTVTLETNSEPDTMLLSSNGNTVVFNDGQKIRSVSTGNGSERWNRPVTGFVTSLSMTPTGSVIIAGTASGNIASLDTNGNISWTYASNPQNRQSAGITCSAVSDKGTIISAGTADGKVLFLNSRGELTASSSQREYIRHIAMSTDGSVVVVASDSHVYTFFPGSSPVIPVLPSPSASGMVLNGSPAPTSLPVQPTLTGTVTPVPTTYSVIRTATRSPPAFMTLLVSLAAAIVLFGRRR